MNRELKQFEKYKNQLRNISEVYKIAFEFDKILNDIWCVYSFNKGHSRWRMISRNIEEPYRSQIDIEIGHVKLGHGINQARAAVKDEMEKYIDFSIRRMNNE